MKIDQAKGNKSGGDTIPGHLTQSWQKPRGVAIPVTQVSIGGEDDDGGGVEVVESLSSGFHGSGSPS